jgi:preprotein translocase subunit YajC
MTINNAWDLIIPTIITIIAGAISVAVTFYIKDVLKRRSQYKNMKNYLDKMAGKNAHVIYNGQISKIEEISSDGIVMNDGVQRVFIPVQSALSTVIVLPVDEHTYESAVIDRQMKVTRRVMDTMVDEMIPKMFNKMIPLIMETVKEQIEDDDGEFSFMFAGKFKKFLKDEGLEVRPLDKKRMVDKASED